MGFNVKDYMLPPGSLIRFDSLGNNQRLPYAYHSVGILAGDIALVLKHYKPVLLDVLVGDKIINLDLERIADIIGWVPEFNPIYCGSGFKEYPRWYPKYCYNYDI